MAVPEKLSVGAGFWHHCYDKDTPKSAKQRHSIAIYFVELFHISMDTLKNIADSTVFVLQV